MECNKLIFFVNGKRVVDDAVNPSISLAHYLRNKLGLTGTKIGCNEGGCGACTVMISEVDIRTNKIRHRSVNACLTPVLSVHGRAVTTIEAVGTARLHAVQRRLATAHGSQCGFCTPGFVMAMYALLRRTATPTRADIDDALQGNLCRCTGYRPILEAFYTFACDKNTSSTCCMNGADCTLVQNGDCCQLKIPNAERTKSRLSNYSVCPEYEPSQEIIFPPELMLAGLIKEPFILEAGGAKWYQPSNLTELLALKRNYPFAKIVFGNTEIGIEQKFKHTDNKVLINPKSVVDLKRVLLDQNGFFIGAGLTLSEMIEELRKASEVTDNEQSCQVFTEVSKMLHRFAGCHVRNMAGFAGNLMTASPISDLNPLWLAAGAQLHVASAERGERSLVIDQRFFLAYRQTRIADDEIVVGITIPYCDPDIHFAGFKQAQRRDDDIAIVNAGIWVRFEQVANRRSISDIRLAFGGMAAITKMATGTMRALRGLEWNETTLQKGLDCLLLDFPLTLGTPGGMERYRQSLVLSFFFKFFHQISSRINADLPPFRTFVTDTHPPLQSTQTFWEGPPDDTKAPVGQPIAHLSAEKHTTGQALYCDDVPVANVLHMAFVLSKEANADIERVDYSAAMQMPDVVGYVDHTHIPGPKTYGTDVPIFAINKVVFFGQVIAGVIAKTSKSAWEAAAVVDVRYFNRRTPIVTIEDAVSADSHHQYSPLRLASRGAFDAPIDWSHFAHVLEGSVRVGGQEHFYLEPQGCVAMPGEDGEMTLIASTQSAAILQAYVADALSVGRHRVVVHVRRIGGGFGGKEATGSAIIAVPTAIAAHRMQCPVKCVLERWDDMALTGQRHPYRCDYKVGVQADGRIRALQQTFYSNCGHSLDPSKGVMERSLTHCDNVYQVDHLEATGELCKTNIQSMVAFRGFGAPQAMFCTETIIEHIADALSCHSRQVRERNFYQDCDITHFGMKLTRCNAKRCYDECIQLADYDRRSADVNSFNRANRWVKRGIAVVPTKFGVSFGYKPRNQAGALVHVYTDGTVLVNHAGMEMGQGLHTKMTQVAAAALRLPLSAIHVHDCATDAVPNGSPTAASSSSDVNGAAVLDACQKILQRLRPIREANPNSGWVEIVQKAYEKLISLSATGFANYKLRAPDFVNGVGVSDCFRYFVYGASCSEVEVDCLTGDHRLLRADMVMDVGDSLNPAVDVGQIEGAFMQGYGLFTMEELKCAPSGEWRSRGPGTYKIPSADDCPRQLHVKLLKDSSNPDAIFSSKAIGEPPLFLGCSAFFAIRNAVRAARRDAGDNSYFRIDSPATAERIRMLCTDIITNKVPALLERGNMQPWTVTL